MELTEGKHTAEFLLSEGEGAISREQVTIYKMAYDHVWFLDRFGQVEFANEDGVLYSQHPEYFKHWLDIGCPGVDEASIQHYLKLKPIKSAK